LIKSKAESEKNPAAVPRTTNCANEYSPKNDTRREDRGRVAISFTHFVAKKLPSKSSMVARINATPRPEIIT
jgi:hypothetical protein